MSIQPPSVLGNMSSGMNEASKRLSEIWSQAAGLDDKPKPVCACCKAKLKDLSDEVPSNICVECKDEYIKKNMDEFKKFIAIKKIQLGK